MYDRWIVWPQGQQTSNYNFLEFLTIICFLYHISQHNEKVQSSFQAGATRILSKQNFFEKWCAIWILLGLELLKWGTSAVFRIALPRCSQVWPWLSFMWGCDGANFEISKTKVFQIFKTGAISTMLEVLVLPKQPKKFLTKFLKNSKNGCFSLFSTWSQINKASWYRLVYESRASPGRAWTARYDASGNRDTLNCAVTGDRNVAPRRLFSSLRTLSIWCA